MSDAVLVCTRVHNADPTMIVGGSTIDTCSQCHEQVYVSPAGHQLLQVHPDAQILCVSCASPLFRDTPAYVTAATIREAIEHVQRRTKRGTN